MKTNFSKNIFLIGAPVIAIIVGYFMLSNGWDIKACCAVGVTIVCAIWWTTEPIPIPATSLLPLSLFPLFGVLDKDQVALSYGSPLVLLLLGGFILSTSMERSGAHRRVALIMINLFGAKSDRRLVFGFMVASALLSMWISNTATTLMLLPIALAILEKAKDNRMVLPLLLGIAHSASVGGIGTPIGTPPNIVFMKFYTEATGVELSFMEWMCIGVPVVVVFLPLVAWWLTRKLKGSSNVSLPDMGVWRAEEKRVLIVFGMTALAWITRKSPFGGWSGFFDLPYANDASVALLAVVCLFIIPNGKVDENGYSGRLLDWKTAERIPWGLLVLFGGGIAIAKAFVSTGISQSLGDALSSVTGLPIILLFLVICLAVTFLTEITSNTASTVLLMPILAAAALAVKMDPALLMVPAAISASCAFMLPVATAPNAIVFGTHKVSIQQMMKTGIVLNLIGAVVITSVCYLVL